jgi:hypothetical protein
MMLHNAPAAPFTAARVQILYTQSLTAIPSPTAKPDASLMVVEK